jgi:hypothetical protein
LSHKKRVSSSNGTSRESKLDLPPAKFHGLPILQQKRLRAKKILPRPEIGGAETIVSGGPGEKGLHIGVTSDKLSEAAQNPQGIKE